jgi:putative ABC transport system permease protein
MLKDLHYGIRMLLKNPGFTVVAVATLALGIGANTAIFSVVNAVLLRPLPFKEPGRLVSVQNAKLLYSLPGSRPRSLDWKDQVRTFEDAAHYRAGAVNVLVGDEPERIHAAQVSSSFFPTLGVEPLKGRWFLDEEGQPGKNRVVILSHGFWRRRLNSDPHVLGRRLILNSESVTVVGIMPASFRFPERAEVWVPPGIGDHTLFKQAVFFRIFARIKSGITLQQAQAEMDALSSQLQKDQSERIRLVALHQSLVGGKGSSLLLLLGAVGFVLLIACANVANLLLARAAAREKEFAVRCALGAGRGRLARQLVLESVLLALIGGGLGVLVAWWGLDLFVPLLSSEVPPLNTIGIDQWVLGFTLTVSLLVGILFGLVPASQARPDLNQSLKESGPILTSGSRHHRVRRLLVVSELALGLVLSVGAGLMIRTLVRLYAIDPGFEVKNILTVDISLSGARFLQSHQVAEYYREAIYRTGSLAGVVSAGAVNYLPLGGGASIGLSVQLEDKLALPLERRFAPGYRVVTPGYFRALGIPLRKGRFFGDRDEAQARKVAIINESMARVFWPRQSPIGKRFRINAPEQGWIEVVGEVGDVRHHGLQSGSDPEFYFPHAQMPSPFMSLVIRTASDPRALIAAARSQIHSVDKYQPVSQIRTMEQVLGESISSQRSTMSLLGIFAVLALFLATIGLYGLMSHSIAQRTHEIGIRMALGAEKTDVLRLVVKEGMKLAGVGIAVGMLASLALTRLLSSQLFGIPPHDPFTFLVVALFLTTVAFFACYIPARRATKVDPIVALRHE